MFSKLTLIFLLLGFQVYAGPGDSLKRIPVQDGGRVKPFDTFARESMQLLHGKQKYQGKDAAEIVFTMMLIPDLWINTPFIEVNLKGLKDAMKISGDEKYFSPAQLFQNERMPMLLQELRTKRDRQEKLNPYYAAVQRLESQLGMFQALRSGEAIRVVPDQSDSWKPVVALEGDLKDQFLKITQSFISLVGKTQSENKSQDDSELSQAVSEFIVKAQAVNPEKYGSLRRINVEVWYNQFHPFMWAWICYLIGALSLTAYLVNNRYVFNQLAWVGLFAGFFLHTLGMVVRIYLAGRPPVSNMYETVVWVPYGALVFAFILERIQKSKLLLLCAAAISILCLILTDLSPTVLDGSIHPLEPVLRSTFWLSTHVLIITIGYAAFFLAFGLGDLLLIYYFIGEEKFAKQIKQGTNSIYRCLQLGVVFLAVGTILGGVWADYSWGRFWGWDPKETWALIALLGYLALLHGRLVGWVKDFGLAAGSIIAFSLVVMAWYGVNFVLGAGLHSYGFGAGGVEYVTAFVVAHLLAVAYVTTLRYGRIKHK